MTYFSLFHLKEEPFSNSPDPTFFYQAPRYTRCLHRLEIAIRLKRGLNVVLGEVGTGKTTLCRSLIRTLQADERIDAHLLLDPQFDTPREFLAVLCRTLCPTGFEFEDTEWRLKERVKNALFRRGVDQGRVVALIIDEGQKIREDCLEILRELLNYETNDAKLLQIVIFAQKEFRAVIDKHSNLADRINELLELGPLSHRETRQLIRHRLERAKDTFLAPELFTPGAYKAVHKVTGGYPRKIMRVCHKTMLGLVRNGQGKATPALVRECARDMTSPSRGVNWWALAAVLVSVVIVGGGIALMAMPGLLDDTIAALRGAGEPVSEAPASSALGSEEQTSSALGAALAADAWFPAMIGDRAGLDPEPFEPAILGVVTLAEDGDLEYLARRVYGPAADRALTVLLRHNPHVMHSGNVAAGTQITVPSLGPLDADELGEAFVVHVADRSSLVEALETADALTTVGVEAGCMPVCRGDRELVFAVIALERFATESSAHEVLAALPESWRGGRALSADGIRGPFSWPRPHPAFPDETGPFFAVLPGNLHTRGKMWKIGPH